MTTVGGITLGDVRAVASFSQQALRALQAASEWRLAFSEAKQHLRPRPAPTQRLLAAENRLYAALRDLDAELDPPKGRVA